MIRKSTVILLAMALVLTAAEMCPAETADALEQSGLKHFREAYFKAAPKNDHARATREFAMAERDFKKALAKQPERISLYLHLGRTYYAQQKYPQAVHVLRQALAIAPDHKPVYLQLAASLEMTGDYDGAIATLNQLRERENEPRALQIIDGFIQELDAKRRAAGE